MPEFDLRGIRCGKYVNTAGVITYTTPTKVGDAMTANLELRFAEGRLLPKANSPNTSKKPPEAPFPSASNISLTRQKDDVRRDRQNTQPHGRFRNGDG